MKSKVYIASPSGHDFSDAERFGDIVYVTDGDVTVFDINKIYRSVIKVVKDSDKGDYILSTGLSSITSVMVQCMSHLHDGVVNYLIYSASEGRYIHRRLNANGMINDNSKG